MSLTTRRPVLEEGGIPYAYIDGQFYFDPEGTHLTMIAGLHNIGMSNEEMKSGIWGWIYNFGAEDDPDYRYDVFSDFLSDALQEDEEDFFAKMEAYFPDAKLTNMDEMPISTHSKWQFVPKVAILDVVNTQAIDKSIANSPAADKAIAALNAAGGRTFVVGGAVRDAALGKDPKDVDLMCVGLPGDVIESTLSSLGRVDLTGKAFGVYRFRSDGDEVEIALPRTEQSTGPGHQDFEVKTDPYLDPRDDLYRRDFTVNAMAYDPGSNSIVDPYGGQDDAANGRLRLVNDRALQDDPLRIVRALVANARFGLQPDDELLDSMKENAQSIRHLPGERIQMELDKLLSAANPVRAMQVAEQTGLLDYLAPELSDAVGFNQYNPHHSLDVWQHTLQVLKKASELSDDPDLRLAALFHDSGKPESFWRDPVAPEGGGGHFYEKQLPDGSTIGRNHEDAGAELVQAFMTRMRYPKARIQRVVTLVQNHMFPYFKTERGARKFLNSLGGDRELAFDLLKIRLADSSGKDGKGEQSEYDRGALEKSMQLLHDVLESDQAFTVKDLDINGRDLMELGLKGPQIGNALKKLLDVVIEEPELNTRDQLMQMVQNGST